ncbi:MAG: S8 family serine peptidase [Candidatus Levybacteria bacterium]|nr:S8 family serine peptidase [Candidatus Levybacteria bacterium]
MSYYYKFNNRLEEVKSRSQKLTKLLKKNKKSIIAVLILIVFPVFVIASQQRQETRQFASEKNKEEKTPPPSPKGYIVEFSSSPAIAVSSDEEDEDEDEDKLDKTLLESSYESNKNKVIAEHQRAKSDVLEKIGKKSFDLSKSKKGDKKVVLLSEFRSIFNGIAIDADEEDIEKIKKSSYVKAVYPNLAVETTLMDSIPLIKADKVWQDVLDSTGAPVTGKGVNVVILDSGIDYTHVDLGGTVIEERPLEKISNKPIINSYNTDSAFSYNQNRIAYASGADQVTIYSFDTKSSEDVSLGTSDITDPSLRLVLLAADELFYISGSFKVVNLYLKNLSSGQVKKIANLVQVDQQGQEDLALISGIASKFTFSADKLYYERQTGAVDGNKNILYALFAYDLSTGQETKILDDSPYVRFAKASENKLVYSVYDPQAANFTKNVVRDLDTGEEEDIIFPGVGPAIDFKNNLILSKSYGSSRTYDLYNIETKEQRKLVFDDSESAQINSPNINDLYYKLPKGLIGDNVIFFERNDLTYQIVAFDLQKNKYSIINLKTFSGKVAGDGKKVCFAAKLDFEIYCHNFDTEFAYPLPSQTYNEKVKGGINFFDSGKDGLDDLGHGTNVAGVAAGSGSLKGAAPGAFLYSYKVVSGEGFGYVDKIIAGIDAAVQTNFDLDPTNDIKVINISLGATCAGKYSDICGPADPMSRSVNNAVGSGLVVVAGAGNGGASGDLISSPGTARRAITVGAIDKSKKIAQFSSRGPVIWNDKDLKKPDVVAPGVEICSAQLFYIYRSFFRCFDDKHIKQSGTSMSTPHVTGLAALILQAHPDWSPAQVKKAIKDTAVDLDYNYNRQGAGLINGTKLFKKYPPATPTPTAAPTPSSRKVNLFPTADSFVRKDRPKSNFGTLKYIQTDSSPDTISFIKFNLRSLADKNIISAKLYLKVDDPSQATQSLKRGAGNNWTQRNINYNNKPSFNATITTFKANKRNKIIELDLINLVRNRKGEVITLGITSSGTNPAKYYSVEANRSNRPKLEVEYN